MLPISSRRATTAIRLLRTLCVLVLLTGPVSIAEAQVTVDSAGTGNSTATPITWSHTVGNGSNRLLLVGVELSSTSKTVSSVTYGAANLTRVATISNIGVVEIWRLVAPPVGAATVTINLSGNTKTIGGSVSFFGVDQGAPLGQTAMSTGTGTNPSDTV